MDNAHRIHALDHLRSHMMLLGIVFHLSLNYSSAPIGADWPYRDVANSGFYTFLVSFLSTFRMPVFFLVAGFFTALLVSRRGEAGLIKNRGQRIVLPFLIFWPLLSAASTLAWGFQDHLKSGGISLDQLQAAFSNPPLYHLWFLYFLGLFYLLILALWRTTKIGSANWIGSLSPYIWNRLTPLLLAIPAGLLLFWNGTLQLSAPKGFMPQPSIILYYFSFFIGGFFLYFCRHKLYSLPRFSLTWFILLLASAVIYLLQFQGISTEQLETLRLPLVAALAQASAVWCLSLLVLNAYLRFATSNSAATRYLTDASYWIYLIHLPLTILIPQWLAETQISVHAKFLVAFVAVFSIAVLSYHLFIRGTWVGVMLNGSTKTVRPRGLNKRANASFAQQGRG